MPGCENSKIVKQNTIKITLRVDTLYLFYLLKVVSDYVSFSFLIGVHYIHIFDLLAMMLNKIFISLQF